MAGADGMFAIALKDSFYKRTDFLEPNVGRSSK